MFRCSLWVLSKRRRREEEGETDLACCICSAAAADSLTLMFTFVAANVPIRAVSRSPWSGEQ